MNKIAKFCLNRLCVFGTFFVLVKKKESRALDKVITPFSRDIEKESDHKAKLHFI